MYLGNYLTNENNQISQRKVVISEECYEKLENLELIEKKNLFLENEIRELRGLIRTYEAELSKNSIINTLYYKCCICDKNPKISF